MGKTVIVEAEWQSVHEVEVPCDWTTDQELPPDALDQIKSHTASLTNWSVEDNG